MTDFFIFGRKYTRTCPQSGFYLNNVRLDDFTSVLPRDCKTLLAPRSPHQSGYIKGNRRNPCAHVLYTSLFHKPSWIWNSVSYEIMCVFSMNLNLKFSVLKGCEFEGIWKMLGIFKQSTPSGINPGWECPSHFYYQHVIFDI